jgi:hypothetical protein
MPPVVIPSSTFEVRVRLYCGLRSSRAYLRAVRCNRIETRPTWNPPTGRGPAPLAIFTHGSDIGRNQLTIWSFATEAHWLRDKGFAVLALMRHGYGRLRESMARMRIPMMSPTSSTMPPAGCASAKAVKARCMCLDDVAPMPRSRKTGSASRPIIL